MDEKSPKTQFAFLQIGLAGVLKQYRLRVPPNQREYSWEDDDQVRRFFRDLARAISDNQPDYFLGTIVTIPRSTDVLEVVDGQQRLATTAILLAAIRNYLTSREKLIARSIESFLTDIDREQRQLVPKLQLNLIDNEYFRTLISDPTGEIENESTRPSHELIEKAFRRATKQVKDIVAGFDPKDHGDVLNRWLTFLEHGATVILVKVPTDRNAYKMFETLNDRGLRTSQADLVKNYLFGESDTRIGEAQEKWALMRGTLDSMDEDDTTVNFLRYALIAMRGHLTTEDVFEKVQAQAKGPQQSIAFLTMLETLATQYVAMFNAEHEKWNSYPDAMRRAIQALYLFNIKPFRSLMLAVVLRFSPRDASDTFRMMISWGVRLLIAGSTRTGSVEHPLAGAAHAVFKSEITDAKGLKKTLASIIPNDQEFQQQFEIARVSKASLARYYLRSLEMKVKKQPDPWFIPNDDRAIINLEHVLPLKPEGLWLKAFKDAAIAKGAVNRLGNLALLLAKQNCDLRSAPFPEKKNVYKAAPYELTSQIATVDDWTHERIVERQKLLAQHASATWPL